MHKNSTDTRLRVTAMFCSTALYTLKDARCLIFYLPMDFNISQTEWKVLKFEEDLPGDELTFLIIILV